MNGNWSHSIIRTLSGLTVGLGLLLLTAPAWAQTRSAKTLASSRSANAVQTPSSLPESAASSSTTKVSRDRSSLRASWSSALFGGSVQDELSNNRQQAGLSIRLGIEYDLSSVFTLEALPEFRFLNGYVQSATRSNGRDNTVELLKAQATLSDRDIYWLSAGILDLSQDHSNLLVANSFPGFRAGLATGMKSSFWAGIQALGAVPTSSTTTDNSEDLQKTPSFQSFQAKLALQMRSFKASLRASLFQYRDLPQSTATDSVLLGNSGLSETNSAYSILRYEILGQELASRVDLQFAPRFSLGGDFAVIRNVSAPEGKNLGVQGTLDARMGMTSAWTLIPSFTAFRVESDATVANFNDGGINTNRIGYRGGFGFQYEETYRITVQGGDRTVLIEKPSQDRERFWNLRLETLNVAL